MVKKKDASMDDRTETNIDLDDLEFEEAKSLPKSKAKKEPAGERMEGEGKEMADEVLEMSEDVPVRLTAVLGQKNILLKDLLKLKIGEVIELDRAPNEFVDIMANDKIVARGELVEIDGKLGVRVIKMLK